MTNMGTEASPEGLPHWTIKNFLAKQLRESLAVGMPYPAFVLEHCSKCEDERERFCVAHGSDADSCGCTEMPRWPTTLNLLEAVTHIKVEETLGSRRPDILLRRKGKPPLAIEVVHSSAMDERKYRDYQKVGAEVLVLGSGHANGKQPPSELTVKPMVEYPSSERIELDSVRGNGGDALIYYQRLRLLLQQHA